MVRIALAQVDWVELRRIIGEGGDA